MTKPNLAKFIPCPKCGAETFTDSPRCLCMECFHNWKISWKLTSEEFWQFNSKPKSKKFIEGLAKDIGVDPKALHILFNSQWDMDGREGSWVSFATPSDEAKYAKKAGVLRPAYNLKHDEWVAKTIAARDALDRRAVAATFVESLTSRRLDRRSILGSYATALHLKPHAWEGDKPDHSCKICGAEQEDTVDVNHSLFRRLMWAGNVRQTMPDYVLCDLVDFATAPPLQEKPDTTPLKAALAAIRKLPAKAGLSDLEKSISGLFPSNKGERQVVLEILGYCGVLKPQDFPSTHKKWVNRSNYPDPTHFFRREWRTPVNCWTGADGVNEEAVEFWFGKL